MIVRRLLFAYTIMFTAGISTGFFIFEKGRLVGGTLFMITVAALVYLLSTSETGSWREEQGFFPCVYRMIALMALGFIIFTCRYIHYERMVNAAVSPENDGNSKSEEIYGLTVSAVQTENSMKLTVITDDRLHKVLISCYGDNHPSYKDMVGRNIIAYGNFREPQSADNPGCFDYRTYLRSKGIGCAFSARSISLSAEDDDRSFKERYIRHLFLLRESFLGQFEDPDIRAFIKGIVFGDKTDIDEDIKEDFSNNGTGHILAVSGLHTGFLYALIRILTGRKRTITATLLTIGVLFMYGEMTMWSTPTVRAIIVLGISMFSIYAGRPFDLLSSASASAFLLLLHEPYQLFCSSFQLSYAALMGISFLCGPISVFIGESLAVPAAVQIGVAPLTALTFHRINVLSVFINIPIIFMASVLVPVCMISLLFITLTGHGTEMLKTVIEGMSEILIKVNNMVSHEGCLSDLVTSCNAGIIVGAYLLIFLIASEWCRVMLIRSRKRNVLTAVFCVLIVSSLFGILTFNTFTDDEIVFVSVGQGDCSHIRAGGKEVLIDGGGNTERNIGKDILMPYLLANGAERLEMALVTHLHTDHCLGILELQQEYPVGFIGIPSDYEKAVREIRSETEKRRIKSDSGKPDIINSLIAECDSIRIISPGSRIYITDDVFIDPVWPPGSREAGQEIGDENENNMVFIINYKGTKIMVTGDLLEEDELEMVKHYKGTDILRCDVLKVAHHGSKSSSSEVFLDAVNPKIAVIQVGRNNFYGHPHAQTLQRLQERNIDIFRTDINGAIGIDIHGTRIKVDVMRGSFGL